MWSGGVDEQDIARIHNKRFLFNVDLTIAAKKDC